MTTFAYALYRMIIAYAEPISDILTKVCVIL